MPSFDLIAFLLQKVILFKNINYCGAIKFYLYFHISFGSRYSKKELGKRAIEVS